MDTASQPRLRFADHTSLALLGLGLLAAFLLHLIPALLGGLLMFSLLRHGGQLLQRKHAKSPRRARAMALALMVSLALLLGAIAILGLVVFWRTHGLALPDLLAKMASALEGVRHQLGDRWIPEAFTDGESLADALSDLMREHSQSLRLVGAEAGKSAAHLLAGMAIGALAAFHHPEAGGAPKPLSEALTLRVTRLLGAFEAVVYAQAKISALNTTLTALFLYAILPLGGIHLPMRPTLIALTFAAGLIPVVGNVLSNGAVVLISLGAGTGAALASLAYLVLIHKLEYFVNARIVGTRIKAQAWEVLLVMVLMEAAFGLAGLVMAPIIYAYTKGELRERSWV
jgi:predicted PurR-regulated permease PerM